MEFAEPRERDPVSGQRFSPDGRMDYSGVPQLNTSALPSHGHPPTADMTYAYVHSRLVDCSSQRERTTWAKGNNTIKYEPCGNNCQHPVKRCLLLT